MDYLQVPKFMKGYCTNKLALTLINSLVLTSVEYRKGYSAQHALLSLLEKWRIALDNKEYAGAVLMDLSKAFDSLNHDLLLAKLHAYGFERDALLLMRSYLTNRWQRTKINSSFSSWSQLLDGIPQGSILGPLLFNIYLNDLFFIENDCDVCNFADDTTYHACDKDLANLIEKLECCSRKAIDWFKYNYMKLNEDKCHILVSGYKHECVIAKIGDADIIESCNEKLLGINIDRELTFSNHVNQIYKKASNKLNALIRQCKILPFSKRRSLMKAFFESHK